MDFAYGSIVLTLLTPIKLTTASDWVHRIGATSGTQVRIDRPLANDLLFTEERSATPKTLIDSIAAALQASVV